jgi:hypothetical protein
MSIPTSWLGAAGSTAFLDHFDRSQVLVIASEVLSDEPREALSAVFNHLADQRTGLARLLTTRRARAGDPAISRELRDRLAERLAPDLRRFEDLLGHQIPSHWTWSATA